MTLLKGFKYQFVTTKKSLFIFYFVIFCLYVVIVGGNFIFHLDGNMSGMEASSMIFLFVIGLNSFKPSLFMFLQNGLTRKNLFFSNIIFTISISALMALIDTVIGKIANVLIPYYSLYQQIYENVYPTDITVFEVLLPSFLWYVFLYIMAASLGLFITTLYYRMNKLLKTLVSVGVPAIYFVILPVLDILLVNINLAKTFSKFFISCLGIMNGYHPMTFVLTCFVSSCILQYFTYLLTRRAIIK